jgi:collagenase-like PrtC family protease
MRIVAGLPGTADAGLVRRLCEAGADEFFLGYLPSYWSARFGQEFSPNRRYRSSCQIAGRRVLDEVCGEARRLGRPVALAFNEHLVTPAAWRLGRRLIREARAAGVGAVIAADPAIVPMLAAEFPGLAVHVSGDAGVCNAAAAELLFSFGARRLILPRELAWPDLRALLCAARRAGREFEVFALGESCVFDGARCFTEHGYGLERDFCVAHAVRLLHRRGRPPRPLAPPEEPFWRRYRERRPWRWGRCGLCALPLLARAGVTHLKVPGRSSDALESVGLLRRVLDAGPAAGPRARSLLGVPRLCASRLLCRYPELSHG